MSGLFSAKPAPTMRRLDAPSTARDFSYDEITALARQYRTWAAEETKDAWRRARLIDWASDCDDIARWVGVEWVPCEPTGRGLTRDLLKRQQVAAKRQVHVENHGSPRRSRNLRLVPTSA